MMAGPMEGRCVSLRRETGHCHTWARHMSDDGFRKKESETRTQTRTHAHARRQIDTEIVRQIDR